MLIIIYTRNLNFVVETLAHRATTGERAAEIVPFCTLLMQHARSGRYKRVASSTATVVVVAARADDVSHILSDQLVRAVRSLVKQQRLVSRVPAITCKNIKQQNT